MERKYDSGNLPNPLEISTEGNKSTVKVLGVFDATNNEMVERALMEELAREEIQIAVADLLDCTFLNEDGVKTLATVSISAKEIDKELQVIVRKTSRAGIKIQTVGLEQLVHLKDAD
jgi:hypothetical protein